MSYSRFGADGGSDVYVYMDVGGYLCCCGCALDPTSFHADTTEAMVEHLAEHRARGHRVPPIEAELWADDAENFPAAAGTILPSEDGEPTCHCGRLAEDDMTICGQCVRRQYASPDGTCCG